jgi:tRNA U34 5-methylaminomethyl-2-thiouridine-forming methyltransferase MnmC
MHRIVFVKPLEDWQLEMAFSDGTRGVLSVKDRLFGPVFEPLKDPKVFSQVRVDEFGAICWPNGADLAPDALYEKLKAQTRAV